MADKKNNLTTIIDEFTKIKSFLNGFSEKHTSEIIVLRTQLLELTEMVKDVKKEVAKPKALKVVDKPATTKKPAKNVYFKKVC